MSRTDKDTPYWVTATWWEPYHARCENGIRNYRIPRRHRDTCNLPAEPVIQHYRTRTWRTGCHWSPDWTRRHYPNPPHDAIRQQWNGPERAAARDECRRAAAEYRATGTVDTIPTTRQHRHCTRWLWS